MTARECDHCDEAVAELMSLVDHDFTGTEVEALNAQVQSVIAAERGLLLDEIDHWLNGTDHQGLDLADLVAKLRKEIP